MIEDTKSYLIIKNHQDGDYKINLVYFLSQIRHYFWSLLGIMSLSLLMALTALFFLKPQYQAISYLSKPGNQYQNIYYNEYTKLGPELFNLFTSKITSAANIDTFLNTTDAQGRPLKKAAINQDKAQNNTIIRVVTDKIGRQDTVSSIRLSTQALTPELARKNNKAYVTFINQITLAQQSHNQKVVAQKRINVLEQSIQSEIEQAAQQRNNELKRLMSEQAFKIQHIQNEIAIQNRLDQREKEIKLKELNHALALANIAPAHQLSDQAPVQLKNNVTASLKYNINVLKNQKHSLEYEKKIALLESKLSSLKNNAHINALKNRTDDVLYIPDIEKVQNELRNLKSLDFDISNLSCYFSENLDNLPVTKVAPNNRSVLFLGFILGLVFSMLYIILKSNLLESDKK